MINVEKTIREYLPTVCHLSLATCVNNKPWVCEVHFVFDSDLTLYFRSRPHKRHSKEMAQNKHVSGNIIMQHEVGQKVRGVYFEGVVEMLEGVDEHHPAYILYCERFDTDKEILADSREENGHKFYKISVSTFYLFDSRESHPSKKYELPWSKTRTKKQES